MKKALLVSLFIFVLIVALAWNHLKSTHGDQRVSYDPAQKDCGVGKAGDWRYCIYRTTGGTNGHVAYLLQGRNLDENTWNDDTFYTSMIQKVWQSKKVSPPTVVSISFGPLWLLAPKNTASKSGLLPRFTDEVVAEVEAKIGQPKSRSVFGESMGGLNALIAGLSRPEQFQKVAALCPGVYRLSPFSSLSEIKSAVERTGAEPLIVLGVVSLAKRFATTEAEWNEMEPLHLAEKFDVKSKTAFYISAPLYDKYGNFEGTEALATSLANRGLQTEWRPIYGGHCAIDVVSLAEFLL